MSEQPDPPIFQVTSTYFCAGGTLDQMGVVTSAAPIIKYMKGWPLTRVIDYAGRKGWTVVFSRPA